MSEYQVLARKYRPRRFSEVIGQEVVVTTLLNAILMGKTAHAYLFCGSRGTGKTSLARLFAKALNCQNPSSDGEPCNQCSSCQEIAGGYSMDVLEIDGASHRGIEDIRQINETINYAPSAGKYKIYLIDEVHMLTKEAFNALLKTLEEPPSKVKFFFATTEPHKLPATILSRCQRFNLRRISSENIQRKLADISSDLGIKAHPDALHLLAQLSEGGLRDAESLLDQVLAYCEGDLSLNIVSEALGILPRDILFSIDRAGHQNDFGSVFTLAKQVFSAGVHLPYFLEQLLLHFRTLLLVKIGAPVDLNEETLNRYRISATYYSEPQCMDILEMVVKAQQEIKFAPSEQIALEMLLLRIIRSHQKIPFEKLIQRLAEMEKKLISSGISEEKKSSPPPIFQKTDLKMLPPDQVESHSLKGKILEDPTPRLEELPSKPRLSTSVKRVQKEEPKVEKIQNVQEEKKIPLSSPLAAQQQTKFETLMRFAAKELDGSLKKES